jgi:hypothetical protein
MILTISSTLETDINGIIKVLSGIESLKDQINLYLTLISGQIPFSNFGNTLILHILDELNPNLINFYVDELIRDISSYFSINLLDYDITIDDTSATIKLYLTNGTIDLTSN